MGQEFLPKWLESMKNRTLKQIESADSWSLVFFDENNSSVISISKNDLDSLKKGLMEINNFEALQEPYLIDGLKFFKVEFKFPF
ncbi:hypothetical protein [Maribellus mangrovi]|uniref:hypothetical protein n=1 Tax=Maribellus mangrovi TaxID=3133146 RepID=UPI0030ED31BD